MDPFLVLLHSVSAGLTRDELEQLKFLCGARLSKRRLEAVRSGLDLFSALLQQEALGRENPGLLRELLAPLRRHDLLRRLDDFEAGAAGAGPPEERDLRAAFEIVCENVGRDWKKLARQLRVSDAKIDAIEERYPKNLAEHVREMLRTWKNTNREDATVSRLVTALRACQLNLVADLVEDSQAQGLQDENKNGAGFPGS